MVFLLLDSVLFSQNPYLLLIGGQGGIKMASASTPLVNEPIRAYHTVKLKPSIKAQISGKLVTSGISDVAITSVHSEKTRLKKMIMIIIITSNRKTIY